MAVSGRSAPGPETTGIGMAQGIASWRPLEASRSPRGTRGRVPDAPVANVDCVAAAAPAMVRPGPGRPDVRLPPQPGTPSNTRYPLAPGARIEIRDGELALHPHLDGRVADQAADAARSAGLPPERRDAVVDAALAGRRDGAPVRPPEPRTSRLHRHRATTLTRRQAASCWSSGRSGARRSCAVLPPNGPGRGNRAGHRPS